MDLEKPSLAKRIQDPTNRGYDALKKIFFTSSPASQASGEAFIGRLSQRKDDLDPASGPKIANAQMAAFREWEEFNGQRFAELRAIRHPTLVINRVHDELIPRRQLLPVNLPNAVLLHIPRRGARLSIFSIRSLLRDTRRRSCYSDFRVGRLLSASPYTTTTSLEKNGAVLIIPTMKTHETSVSSPRFRGKQPRSGPSC